MFNNRGAQPARVAMKVELRLIRATALTKDLHRLYSTLRSVQVPHLFFVDPGRDERHLSFEMPFDCRIHLVGAHVHPYATSMELYNVSRQEAVWIGTHGKQEGTNSLGVYSSRDGYRVRAGETFRITSVYDNPTAAPIDAMAGLFIFYSDE